MNKKTPQLLKGFRDYLPNEQMARNKITAKITEAFERFGFAPIDTPALEYYELLAGKYGEEGEKLMYKFKDQGGRQVALRYDLTVPLARVVSMYPNLPKPLKRYQVAPVWRADKPQKGRFRELMQCDADIVGSDSVNADAEVIGVLIAAYKNLGVGSFTVKFNNRKLVDQALSELGVPEKKNMLFMRILDKLDKVGKTKVNQLLKEEKFASGLLGSYAKIMDKLSRTYIIEMENLLSGLGVEQMQFDKFLMRGLDYYTGIIFEFTLSEKPEYGSMGGGGRYDQLIKDANGNFMPAVGGSIGLDRLFAALQEMKVIAPQTAAEVLILNLDKNLTAEYFNIATNLRSAGIDCEFYYEPAKLDKQFKYAAGKNINVVVIYGPNETKTRKVNLKKLSEKRQVTVDLDNLVIEVKSMLW